MASRTITRVEARRRGESSFITDSSGNVRNYLPTGTQITTEDAFTVDNRVEFDDVDPFVDLDEIRIVANFGTGNEESIFSYYESEFARYPFEALNQASAFEIRPILNRGDSIEVSLSVTRDTLYFRTGRPLPQGSASPPVTFPRSNRRPDPVRIGDVGSVEGILPYAWYGNDAYAAEFGLADRQILPENDGRPLRYSSYFSVDECNQLLLNNPRVDPNLWPFPDRIAEGRFARDPADVLAMKSRYIIRATNFMDVAFEWRGIRATWQQNLEWPRWDVFERSGYWHDPGRVPEKIKQAYADFAYELASEDRLLATDESSRTGLDSLNVGDISLSFNPRNRKQIIPQYIDVEVKEFYFRAFASKSSIINIPY